MPQINLITQSLHEIIKEVVGENYDKSLNGYISDMLFADINCRESQLTASAFCQKENFSLERAYEWMRYVNDVEVADILCMKQLRYLDNANDFVAKHIDSDKPIYRYTCYRLLLNIVLQKRDINIDLFKPNFEKTYSDDIDSVNVLKYRIIEEINNK